MKNEKSDHHYQYKCPQRDTTGFEASSKQILHSKGLSRSRKKKKKWFSQFSTKISHK